MAGSLAGLAATGVWLDWLALETAATLTLSATGLGETSNTGLETGLTADFLMTGFLAARLLSAGLAGAAALTTDSAGFLTAALAAVLTAALVSVLTCVLTAALAPAAGWVALAMGFTAVLSGVFGFTGGFVVAFATGNLPTGFLTEAACGWPCASDATGPCDGVVWVFRSARDCSGSAGRRDPVKPNRWRTDLNIKLHCAF